MHLFFFFLVCFHELVYLNNLNVQIFILTLRHKENKKISWVNNNKDDNNKSKVDLCFVLAEVENSVYWSIILHRVTNYSFLVFIGDWQTGTAEEEQLQELGSDQMGKKKG